MPANRSIPVSILAAACTFLVLGGCGGGGGGGGGNPPPVVQPPPPSTQSGVFKDSNVSGLDFVSGQEAGTTGANGRFTCETGQSVSFAVGAVQLGSAMCTTLLSPPALVASGQFDDPEAINIARFVQVLDVDEQPANGITISAGLQAVADSWPAVDFTAADLDSQLATVYSDIQSVDGRTVTAAPEPAAALAHMDAALACAYGGAFIGNLVGTNSGTVAFVLARRLFGFSPDEFQFLAYDPDEEFILSTSGRFTFSANSVLDSTLFDQTVIVQATFTDPDNLSGTWSFPPENASGTLNAFRLGDDTGGIRFVGDFSALDSRGVLSMNVDENGNFSGTAFDITDNSEVTLSAQAPQTNPFNITVTGGGTTFTASTELTVDSFGNLRLDGSWDDGSQSGGIFNAIGCVLNPVP